MKIKHFVCGFIEENGYVVYLEKGGDCYIIDPGSGAEDFLDFVKEQNLKVKGILLTHHHPDHTGAVNGIVKALGCSVFIHERDAAIYGRPVELLRGGDKVILGEGRDEVVFDVVNTPGHTMGSVCFVCLSEKVVFTGDTIFADEVGRSDLEDSHRMELAKSIRTIVDKWDDGMKVYPGHGPLSDMGHVKAENPDYRQAMERSNGIKLIALDLDGTTLDSKGKLPAVNKEALENAIARGVNVVVASGRCFNSLPGEVLGIDGIQYAISSNGAQVRDLSRENEVIESDYISPEAIRVLYDIVTKHNYKIEVFIDGFAYIDKADYDEIRANGIAYRNMEYILRTRTPIENMLEYMLEHDNEIENINLVFENLDDRWPIRETLKPLDGLATITTSFDHNWEIGSLTTSKAAALVRLCERLGFTANNMMACGDNPNDIPMLQAAGIAVAVGNAKPEVKEAAHFVSTDNNSGGVAAAVKKFVTEWS